MGAGTTDEYAPESTSMWIVADRLGASRLLISTSTLRKPMGRALLAREPASDVAMSPYLVQDGRRLNMQWGR
jgi:hypothetical protein